jgi:hypothetical protein
MKVEARVVGKVVINPDEHIVLDHIHLRDCDYSSRRLKQFCTIHSRLEGCSFRGTEISDAQFGSGQDQSEFYDCDFDGAKLIRGGGFYRMVRCSFKNADLRKWTCYEAEFIDCIFTGRLTACIFNGAVPEKDRSWVGRERNEFRGNDFSGAELIDVSFRSGIDLTQQRLPTGEDYLYLPDAATAIASAQAAVAEWYDEGLRKDGLKLLEVTALGLRGGQRQLLLRADNYYGVDSHEVVDGVFTALREARG